MLAPWKKICDQTRHHIRKQRHYFADKGPFSQGYGFSSGHVLFAIIISHSEWLSFHLAYSFLCCTKAFTFNQVPLVYFCFYFYYSRRWVIKDLALIYVIECSMSSSKSFVVSGLTFRSLIHFEFIFVCGVRK